MRSSRDSERSHRDGSVKETKRTLSKRLREQQQTTMLVERNEKNSAHS